MKKNALILLIVSMLLIGFVGCSSSPKEPEYSGIKVSKMPATVYYYNDSTKAIDLSGLEISAVKASGEEVVISGYRVGCAAYVNGTAVKDCIVDVYTFDVSYNDNDFVHTAKFDLEVREYTDYILKQDWINELVNPTAVTSVSLQNSIEDSNPDNYDEVIIVDEKDLGTIKAYHNGTEVTIVGDKIYAPVDSSSLFKCAVVEEICGLGNLDTSKATNMCEMFSGNIVLSTIEGIDTFDTSNVTDMSSMFFNCNALTSELDLSEWDVSNVKDMSYMFNSCNTLTSVKLDDWSIESATTIINMFEGCSSIVKLDLTSFDVSSAEFTSIFDSCNDDIKVYVDQNQSDTWLDGLWATWKAGADYDGVYLYLDLN